MDLARLVGYFRWMPKKQKYPSINVEAATREEFDALVAKAREEHNGYEMAGDPIFSSGRWLATLNYKRVFKSTRTPRKGAW